MKSFQQFQEDVSKLPGLGGGGGGTDSITAKSSAKSFKKRVKDYIKSKGLESKRDGNDFEIYLDKGRDFKGIPLLNESKKKKKKDPPIGKPKRGGPKAYYVYVRDPKTKRIKKVTFGSGGLKAKIRNKKARNAFAARHRCKTANDRTTARYWSCRLPRYAKLLGLGSNMNTFW